MLWPEVRAAHPDQWLVIEALDAHSESDRRILDRINADLAADAGIYLSANDQLRRLRGVGGHEHVFLRRVGSFAVGARGLDGFDVEIGEMDYGQSHDRVRVGNS